MLHRKDLKKLDITEYRTNVQHIM